MHRPSNVAPLIGRCPVEVREYIGRLERAVAFDDPAANRVGASHTFDPQTSRDAAQVNYPRSGNQRHRVLVALAARGERGATFEELIDATGIKSAAKRLTELKAGEWAWATGRTRPTSMGAPAEVHRVTAKALARLELERHETAGGNADVRGPTERNGSCGLPPADHLQTAGVRGAGTDRPQASDQDPGAASAEPSGECGDRTALPSADPLFEVDEPARPSMYDPFESEAA